MIDESAVEVRTFCGYLRRGEEEESKETDEERKEEANVQQRELFIFHDPIRVRDFLVT